MIVLLLAAVLLQTRSLAVMTPDRDDRLTAELFRADAHSAATLLAESAAEEPTEVPVVGGMALVRRGFDASGRAALLLTPVPGTGARQGQACRIVEVRPEGQDNTARAVQWCRNTLGTGMIAR